MVISVQWLAVGVVGSTSLVAAVAALPPPPLAERAPVAASAPVDAVAASPCADEVWPRVSPACAGITVAGRPVRYVSLDPAAAIQTATVARATTPRIAAPSPPAPTPVATTRRPAEARTAKRHGGAGKVREARRAPVVRVSLAPAHAVAPQPAYTYTIGPRPDR